jgi:hypothetical protein
MRSWEETPVSSSSPPPPPVSPSSPPPLPIDLARRPLRCTSPARPPSPPQPPRRFPRPPMSPKPSTAASEAPAAASLVALRVSGFFYPLPSQAHIACHPYRSSLARRRRRRRPQNVAALAGLSSPPPLLLGSAPASSPYLGPWLLQIALSPPLVHPTTPYSPHLIRLPPPRADVEMSR